MLLISKSPKESIWVSVKLDNKCTKVGIQKNWKNNANKSTKNLRLSGIVVENQQFLTRRRKIHDAYINSLAKNV